VPVVVAKYEGGHEEILMEKISFLLHLLCEILQKKSIQNKRKSTLLADLSFFDNNADA
jgi:hypothetical protein